MGLAAFACHRSAPTPAALASAATDGAAQIQITGRLPEDAAAGRAATAQWRTHLADEERERQLGYDLRKRKEHQSIVHLLTEVRAQYDRAGSDAAVAKAKRSAAATLTDVQHRIVHMDKWGVNSRLLAPYARLVAAFTEAYPQARLAAIHGDDHAWNDVRADVDHQMKLIADWLTAAAASEDESSEREAEVKNGL